MAWRRGRRWQLDGTLDQHSFQVTHISLYLQTLEGLVTVVTPSTKAHLKNSLSADSWKSFILGLLIQQFQTIAAAHSVTAKHHGRASRSKSWVTIVVCVFDLSPYSTTFTISKEQHCHHQTQQILLASTRRLNIRWWLETCASKTLEFWIVLHNHPW